jgi:hypothetical protein
MADDLQAEMNAFLARLQSRISSLVREKNILFDQFVDTLTDKIRFRRLINRWQTLAIQLYNQNEVLTSDLCRTREHVRHWKQLCKTNDALGEERESMLRTTRHELRNSTRCTICWTRPMNCLLRPCRHGKFCETCVAELTRCPLCRTSIDESVKYFI